MNTPTYINSCFCSSVIENADAFVNRRHSIENINVAFAIGNKLKHSSKLFGKKLQIYRTMKLSF